MVTRLNSKTKQNQNMVIVQLVWSSHSQYAQPSKADVEVKGSQAYVLLVRKTVSDIFTSNPRHVSQEA